MYLFKWILLFTIDRTVNDSLTAESLCPFVIICIVLKLFRVRALIGLIFGHFIQTVLPQCLIILHWGQNRKILRQTVLPDILHEIVVVPLDLPERLGFRRIKGVTEILWPLQPIITVLSSEKDRLMIVIVCRVTVIWRTIWSAETIHLDVTDLLLFPRCLERGQFPHALVCSFCWLF